MKKITAKEYILNKIFENPGISRGEIQTSYRNDTGRTGQNANVWYDLNLFGYIQNVRNGHKNALFLTPNGAYNLITRIKNRTGYISEELEKSIKTEAAHLEYNIKKFENIKRLNKMKKDFI